ncbi:MAG: hypothetical protein IJ003_01240 [Candidatus Gastranaerophilales bacterium]|nr:hypothetical protein [Candidatus Gastranaerophilales bacterium]
MKKNILSLILLGFLLIFTSGCGKYAYNIEIDSNNNITFEESFGLDNKLFKMINPFFDEVYSKDINNLLKEAMSQNYTTSAFEEDSYKGLKKNKKETIETLNNSILPAGFNSEQRAPIAIKRSCIKIKYVVSMKFDLNQMIAIQEHLYTRYKIKDNDKELLKGKLTPKTEENNQEEVSENPEKLIENLLTPDMKFKLKVPIKAKKHNAHEVLNDYEYVWNINTKEPVSIELVYEEWNIPGLIFTFITFILILIISIISLKNKKDN